MSENLTENLTLPSNADAHTVAFSDSFNALSPQDILNDYKICVTSRELSLMTRREVLTGKGKFGISGDGKEVPQVAMARAFRKGDWRSGYYRDQTWMMAVGICTPEQFFAQLYSDNENDVFSGGRQMTSHFATPMIDKLGNWLKHKSLYNTASDISCTGGQMARAVGLALASKKYRESSVLQGENRFSELGNEICYVTIGDASTSEGVFWEAINAAGVMQIPMSVSIWDDGYGISVPTTLQTIKGNISAVLKGFEAEEGTNGIDLYVCNGWDYPALCELYQKAAEKMRRTHRPAVLHIKELTQTQGHSTSGSHERYKDKARLEWEKDHDCIKRMREWMLHSGIATETELLAIEQEAKQHIKLARARAWIAYSEPIEQAKENLIQVYKDVLNDFPQQTERIENAIQVLQRMYEPLMCDLLKNARQLLYHFQNQTLLSAIALSNWVANIRRAGAQYYTTHLYSSSAQAALNIPIVPPIFTERSVWKNGYEIINTFFDKIIESDPRVVAFGEDVGQIGDVNQGFMGLQAKYGANRVFDTGIREWTIMGQAIGMAMRGLRPIAEIQYLDYLLYGLEPLSDDLATLRYRTNGIQQAPAIIRSRGHRLEGIWHSGSPMGMMIHALRGIYICVPRNMTQAAGMYKTLLLSDDPGIVVECLNGYRLKEQLPDNIGLFTVPLGVPEVMQVGTDVTLVTYGSCVRIAQEAMDLVAKQGLSVELIDIQTLLPFDLEHVIVESLKKTNRVLFLDEDVPGGATAYMMQEVLENQSGYQYLDTKPRTLTAKANRTPYGSNGDYFVKPSAEDVADILLEMMME
jgi:pyruvate/2-oxoglutarate/acetoin dehydrogenase E1 component/TPP-dependent pyruvate/acetoin dehydrogenase alpha subunit